MCESQCSEKCSIHAYMPAYIHNRCTYTCTFSRPQKTSRLDRNFFFGMAARSGLNIKMYRAPMLTTRPHSGDRTSTRSHVAKILFTQLERMADTATPLSRPYHQEPFWKFLDVSRCRSLSSTSSPFSGILSSPVRRTINALVVNRLLPPHAHTAFAFADQGEGNIGERAERVLYSISPLTLFRCSNL